MSPGKGRGGSYSDWQRGVWSEGNPDQSLSKLLASAKPRFRSGPVTLCELRQVDPASIFSPVRSCIIDKPFVAAPTSPQEAQLWLGFRLLWLCYLGYYSLCHWSQYARVVTPKIWPLCTSAELNLGDRVLGEAEKNSFIALPGKGRHRGLMPSKFVYQLRRTWWGV